MAFEMNVDEISKEAVAVEPFSPTKQEKDKIALQAESNTKELMAINLDSLEERRNIAKTIDDFGMNIVSRSSEKNRIIEKTLGELSKTGSESGVVVKSLVKLSDEMKGLDPSKVNFQTNGLLGKMFSPVKGYFKKFEKADGAINSIINSLDEGKLVLQRDNHTLEVEQAGLRDLIKKLSKDIELGMSMDEAVVRAVEQAKISNDDPEKIKYMEEEVLFPLRQKVMDLQQMQAVNQQGYFAMEIVMRNNKELMRAVDRAKHVTVSALRTAVTVSVALYNQRIVLDKVKLINKTTNDLIMSTSNMLKEQGAEIQKQAVEANITVDTLREAFRNTFDALDQLDVYKQKALPQLKKSIMDFHELAEEGDNRMARMEANKVYREGMPKSGYIY